MTEHAYTNTPIEKINYKAHRLERPKTTWVGVVSPKAEEESFSVGRMRLVLPPVEDPDRILDTLGLFFSGPQGLAPAVSGLAEA